MNKKIFISIVGGGLISVACLYLAFRNIPLAELWQYLTRIQYLWILPSIALVMVAFLLRVLRWQLIIDRRFKILFKDAYHPLMVAFMLNCVLPARLGELARPALLQKNKKVPFTTGLATVAAERLLDAVSLLGLFSIVMATLVIDPELDIPFGRYHLNKQTLAALFYKLVVFSLILLSGLLLVGIKATRLLLEKMIIGLPKAIWGRRWRPEIWVHQRISLPLIKIIGNLHEGLNFFKSPRKLIVCLGLTLLIWGLSAYSYLVFAMGCPGITLTYGQLFAYMIIICFLIALPSVPGFWGLWEAGGMFALALFGIGGPEAMGFTLANHGIQMIPIIIAGLISALISGATLSQVTMPSKDHR